MLIAGGTVIDEAGERPADLRIGADGRVAEVAPGLTRGRAEQVHDATGKLVVPGGIDAHTHMQLQVGAVRVSDDFASGTRAAALGGTTTIIDYVTPERGEDPLVAATRWRALAEPSAVDWGLHLTFTEVVPEAVVATAVESGISSFKLYLAYPDRLQVDDGAVVDLMRSARRRGALVTLHCENGAAIEQLRREALAAGRTAVIEHACTRPPLLEAEATARGGGARRADRRRDLRGPRLLGRRPRGDPRGPRAGSRRPGGDLPAVPLPRRDEARGGRRRGLRLHPPAARTPARREALGGAGTGLDPDRRDRPLSVLACRPPRRRGRPPRGRPRLHRDPGRPPGRRDPPRPPVGGGARERISAPDWVRLCAGAPAHIFGLWPTKGSLSVGADADVVVWDPTRRQPLEAGNLDMAVDHSPYAGMVATGWPELVLSRGRVVARDGRFAGEPGWGRYQARAPLNR